MINKEKNAQTWLDEIPNKNIIKSIGRTQAGVKDEEFWGLADDEVLKGELKITDFPELKLVRLRGRDDNADKGLLTKVIIKNCSKLENVNLIENEISELDVSGLGNLKYLLVNNNKLGKVNVEGCVNLEWIITFDDENTKEEWRGLEDLERVARVEGSSPFFPVQNLKNLKVIISPEGLGDILNPDGTINKDKLKEYKESKGKTITQEQLDKAVADERKKFENHVDPKNLKDAATKAGFGFTQEDIDNAAKGQLGALVAVNQKIQGYEAELRTALGLSPNVPLPVDWSKQIISKTKYDKLEIYSTKQGTVISILESRLRQTGMMQPGLQAQIQQLPQFKP